MRSAPTPSNKTAWNHATPGDAGGKKPGAATNDKGKPTTGKPGATPTPTRGNATKPAPTNGKPGAAPVPARPAPKPVIQ